MSTIVIQETVNADFNDIMGVQRQAFGSDEEAELTANLLKDSSAEPVLSLLARDNTDAVGHILFTRASIIRENINEADPLLVHILAPLAVIPGYQNRGIGGMLVRNGLEILKEWRTGIVFVLGHIEYYPRHGFIPDAGKQGFAAPYPIPKKDADAWMLQALTPQGRDAFPGKVRCADALNRPEYWVE